MKSLGILFQAPLVRALLNTRIGTPAPIDPSKPFKGCTRRLIKPQPEPKCDHFILAADGSHEIKFARPTPIERIERPDHIARTNNMVTQPTRAGEGA